MLPLGVTNRQDAETRNSPRWRVTMGQRAKGAGCQERGGRGRRGAVGERDAVSARLGRLPTAAVRPIGDAVPADLRINEIQVLGTHNSYHVEPPPDILSVYLGVRPGRDRPRGTTHAARLTTAARRPRHPPVRARCRRRPRRRPVPPDRHRRSAKVLPHRADRRGVHLPRHSSTACPRSSSGLWATPTTCRVTVLVEFKIPGEVEGVGRRAGDHAGVAADVRRRGSFRLRRRSADHAATTSAATTTRSRRRSLDGGWPTGRRVPAAA